MDLELSLLRKLAVTIDFGQVRCRLDFDWLDAVKQCSEVKTKEITRLSHVFSS